MASASERLQFGSNVCNSINVRLYVDLRRKYNPSCTKPAWWVYHIMLHGWSLLLDSVGKAVNPSGSHAHHLTSWYLYVKARVNDSNDVISAKQQCRRVSFTTGDVD